MRKIISILLIFTTGIIFCQTDSLKVNYLSIKSSIIHNQEILAIDNNGKLNIWNLKTLKKTFQSNNQNTFFTSLGKNKNDDFFIGTKNGRVLKFDKKDNSIKQFLKLKKNFWTVEDIVFNKRNEMFLMMSFGIYETQTDKLWTEFEHKGVLMTVYVKKFLGFKKRLKKYFSKPDYTFIDKNQIMWMSKTFGEFGSVMQLFDLENKKIINLPDSLHFGKPKSIFDKNNGTIFITSGLHHFMQSGSITEIKNFKTIKDYDSKELKSKNGELVFPNEIFIGVGNYNPYDNKIYFSTTKGIYKTDYLEGEGLKNVELVFQPKLIWKQEPLAIGIDTAIKKMDFLSSGDIILITESNGIGICRNNKLNWLN